MTITTDLFDAIRWRKLMSLCGHLGDGSQTVVKLYQDDATRHSVHIIVGDQLYYGSSFESVIDKIPEESADNSDGIDDAGNEYELTGDDKGGSEPDILLTSSDDGAQSEDEDSEVEQVEPGMLVEQNAAQESQEPEEREENTKDPIISQIETKAKNLAYAITNPETLSRKLREELVSIVGPEAAVTYHLSASFDSSSQQVKFQVARLSPSTVFRLKSDLRTTEVGFAYIKTVNGWRVAVGLTANAVTGDDAATRVRAPQGSSDGVDVSGTFSVTVSR